MTALLQEEIHEGDTLIAIEGNRRVRVEKRNGELWTVPLLRDGMDDCLLIDWLPYLLAGCRRLDPPPVKNIVHTTGDVRS